MWLWIWGMGVLVRFLLCLGGSLGCRLVGFLGSGFFGGCWLVFFCGVGFWAQGHLGCAGSFCCFGLALAFGPKGHTTSPCGGCRSLFFARQSQRTLTKRKPPCRGQSNQACGPRWLRRMALSVAWLDLLHATTSQFLDSRDSSLVPRPKVCIAITY